MPPRFDVLPDNPSIASNYVVGAAVTSISLATTVSVGANGLTSGISIDVDIDHNASCTFDSRPMIRVRRQPGQDLYAFLLMNPPVGVAKNLTFTWSTAQNACFGAMSWFNVRPVYPFTITKGSNLTSGTTISDVSDDCDVGDMVISMIGANDNTGLIGASVGANQIFAINQEDIGIAGNAYFGLSYSPGVKGGVTMSYSYPTGPNRISHIVFVLKKWQPFPNINPGQFRGGR